MNSTYKHCNPNATIMEVLQRCVSLEKMIAHYEARDSTEVVFNGIADGPGLVSEVLELFRAAHTIEMNHFARKRAELAGIYEKKDDK